MTETEQKLKTALENTLRSFEAHLIEEAHREGVTTEMLCACKTTEVKAGRELLASLK